MVHCDNECGLIHCNVAARAAVGVLRFEAPLGTANPRIVRGAARRASRVRAVFYQLESVLTPLTVRKIISYGPPSALGANEYSQEDLSAFRVSKFGVGTLLGR